MPAALCEKLPTVVLASEAAPLAVTGRISRAFSENFVSGENLACSAEPPTAPVAMIVGAIVTV